MITAAQFDHLVVAIRSLPEGMAEFERWTGVRAMAGGQHPGRGTENALVSLGSGKYLEIIAPQQGARLSPTDEAMRALDQLRIIAWAVAVSDIDAAVAALTSAGFATTPPQPGARLTPSGERLEWTTFGLAQPPIAMPPFFIQWGAATRHPSITAPGGCELTQFIVTEPESDRLSAALAALGVAGVTHARGVASMEATLTCGAKTATLRTV